MTVTAQLLKFFRVDQQLRGLQTRLTAADEFLAEQERQHGDLEAKHTKLATSVRQAKAAQQAAETEAAALETKMASLREQMNVARTNKDYSAFLSELNALKARKDEFEKTAIGHMEQIESMTKQQGEAETAKAERHGMVHKAKGDRTAKATEIKDRVDELKGQREALAKEIPADTLKLLNELIHKRGDEAMAHVEELDRRNHEWTCGSCNMAVTVQVINMITQGRLTRCTNCGCILFTENPDDVVSKKAKKADDDDVPAKRVKKPKAATKEAKV